MKSKNIYQSIKLWLPLVTWMLVIFFFSNRPTGTASAFDPLDFVIKKTAHLTEYAFLTILLFRAIYQAWNYKFKLEFLENWSIVFCFLYAVSDEWHQSFIGGRTATIRDILIDFIGIMIGVSIIKIVKNQARLRKLKLFVYGYK